MCQDVMQLDKTVNKGFKNFGCLKQVFWHNLIFHLACFHAVVAVTQMAFDKGKAVFQIDMMTDKLDSMSRKNK